MNIKDLGEDVCCFRYKDGSCQVINHKLEPAKFTSKNNNNYKGKTCSSALNGKLCGWCYVQKITKKM